MTVLRESPAGIIPQKFLWLEFHLLFQCLTPGVKRNPFLFEGERSLVSCFLQVFIFLLSSICRTEASVHAGVPWHNFVPGRVLQGFLFDAFHCKIMSLCSPQDGCAVMLAGLSSAVVSMGFTGSADCQTLLRCALGAFERHVHIS